MNKEELKKEAEDWLNKWELCNKCENKVDCISNFSYCKKVVLQSYLASAEPRERRIEELEKELNYAKSHCLFHSDCPTQKENAELRKIAEFQQSSNMNTHLENKKLKEGLAVGSIFNKALNSMNKSLEEERDRCREMTFDMKDQLTKAIEILKKYHIECPSKYSFEDIDDMAEQFLSEVENEKHQRKEV